MDPIRRRVLVLTVASWLLWSAAMELRTPRHPWADLSNGWFSDHYSHLNAARALPRVGLDLYRRGAAEDFPVATEPLPSRCSAAPNAQVRINSALRERPAGRRLGLGDKRGAGVQYDKEPYAAYPLCAPSRAGLPLRDDSCAPSRSLWLPASSG